MRYLKLVILFLAVLCAVGVLSFFNIDESTDELDINNVPENDEEGEGSIVDDSAHNYLIECSSCGQIEDYRHLQNFDLSIEDYGSIGFCAYSFNCGYCGNSCNPDFSLYHVYSKSGMCTCYGCTVRCDHTLTSDAIDFVIPNDERFSMIKDRNLTHGDSAAYSSDDGFDMYCAICGTNLE